MVQELRGLEVFVISPKKSEPLGSVASSITCPFSYGFFLWEAIKDKVYRTPPTTPEDMREWIRNECSSIGEEVLIKVQRVHVQ
ncbi:hypothetical protein J6590_095532 [Homalodisca vitripennis]|nr:hypothetical protein J6590_095532 [Homalodisca vitripennis]